MRSTDNNISTPTSLKELDIIKIIESTDFFKVQAVTQHFYDLLQTPDPCTLYMIIGTKTMYLGTRRIERDRHKMPKYCMAMNDKGEYVIYIYELGDLVEIQRFDNIDEAIGVLNVFNKLSSHSPTTIKIYSMILSYKDGDIGIHDLIMGIMITYNYNVSERINEVNSVATSYGVDHMAHELPKKFIEDLPILMKRSNILFTFYEKLYEVTVKTNNFKYVDDKIIADITKIFV